MSCGMAKFFANSLVFALLVGAFVGGSPPLPDGRIIGGDVTSIEAFPYQVSLRYYGIHMCGGSILNSRAILTAAHCVDYNLNQFQYTVQYGMNSTVSSKNVINIDRFVRNWRYNPETLDYDIAIVFLKQDIPFSAVAQPIPLAEVNPAPGTKAIVTGWGVTEEGGTSSFFDLIKVEVEILPKSICASEYASYNDITDRMLCAGVDGGGKDACQGDSGGPLAADGLLVGVVSWGVGCGRPEFAGVYSSVAELRPWIDDILRP